MKKAEPKWWAWILSVLSLGLFVFIVILVKLPFDQYEKALRAKEVRENLKQQLYAEAKANAAGLFSNSLGEKIFSALDKQYRLIWRVDPNVLPLIDIIELFSSNDSEKLQAGLDTKFSDDAREGVFFSNSVLAEQLSVFKLLLMEKSRAVERLESVRRARSKLAPEYIAARDTLRLFLGFSVLENTESSWQGEDKFTFYSAGVLEGLPKIHELPNEYQDLQEFRKVLDDLAVQVQVGAVNPMQDFIDTLNEIRGRSLKVCEALQKLKDSELEYRDQLKKLESEVKYNQKNIKRSLEISLNLALLPPSLFERLNSLIIH